MDLFDDSFPDKIGRFLIFSGQNCCWNLVEIQLEIQLEIQEFSHQL
jgi:hypothetical protein